MAKNNRNNHQKNSLDFNMLPNDSFFGGRPMLKTIPEELEARLGALPQTLERVRASVMFADQSGKETDPLRAAAYLRAALADFRSIDEMQKADKPRSRRLKLDSLKDPLPHLLKLVRNLNIHEKTMQAVPRSVPAAWMDHQFSLEVFVISNLNAADLATGNNLKFYEMSDLRKMVDWFGNAQLHWGAGYIVRIGAESLANAICTHHGF